MKKELKSKLMKTNFFYGLLLLSTGIILEFSAGMNLASTSYVGLNLNIKEFDKVYDVYESDNSDNSDNNQQIIQPVSYSTDNKFGWPTSPNYRLTTYYSYGHPAIDIVTTDGDRNVYAAYSGVIVTNTYKWDGGNYIILKQDNGYYSLYCHLLVRSPMEEGTRVSRGQVIGTIGSTGLSTGPHLHYSIWDGYPYYGSKSYDPLSFY